MFSSITYMVGKLSMSSPSEAGKCSAAHFLIWSPKLLSLWNGLVFMYKTTLSAAVN